MTIETANSDNMANSVICDAIRNAKDKYDAREWLAQCVISLLDGRICKDRAVAMMTVYRDVYIARWGA
jgi:hypothetical protein